jgi:hypothetical protein
MKQTRFRKRKENILIDSIREWIFLINATLEFNMYDAESIELFT